jgi:hypothetical protein
MTRRKLLHLALGSAVALPAAQAGIDHLPLRLTFEGEDKFAEIVRKAQAGNWSKLPVGSRVALIAREFTGTPYVPWTLEIHDSIESPSVNLNGLDCWTLFEVALGTARMLKRPHRTFAPVHLLQEIQWTRYRAGHCSGSYLDRMHYLTEWFIDNEARNSVRDITRSLPGAQRLTGRISREMSAGWSNYRYLKENPELIPAVAKMEERVTKLPVFYVPKAKVAAVEGKLADGDIAGIVTTAQGGVCSHVGLIIKDEKGRPLFFHASRNYRKVTFEGTISTYLNTYTSHAGLIVTRPLGVASEVRDAATYQRNLKALSRA